MCLDISTNKLNAGYAEEAWPSVEARMQAALSSIQTASGSGFPASFGLGQRQSGSQYHLVAMRNRVRHK